MAAEHNKETDDVSPAGPTTLPGAGRGSAHGAGGPSQGIGDVSVDMPPGGTATQGAAQGAGLSRGAADPQSLASADPGAGGATTGEPMPAAENARAGRQTGLGEADAGGRLQDFDNAFSRRDDEIAGDVDARRLEDSSGGIGGGRSDTD
jgi:hypothetical protein